ncbi:Proline-rich protein 5 [Liparis tanakae]|uniref:Proline-rich protein 5 n=1 Tax=Liparis tanakae TaxID=230148 RepID=A0A4Z2FW67_9TELE|nr:Proline-rich protein 5 [Liparis tanakae]
MLLILQGVHESKGVTDVYLRLESLIQKVVSPYLGTHGLYSRDGSSHLHCSSCLLEKRLPRSWPSKPGSSPIAKNPVVRSKSYNVPMLTPVVEHDSDSPSGGGAGIRRHSVSEMTSCLEETASLAESTTTAPNASTPSLANHSPASTVSAALSDTVTSGRDPPPRDAAPRPVRPQKASPGEDTHLTGSLVSASSASSASSRALAHDTSSGSSLEITMDHVPESLDSEHDGIFLDFQRCRSGGSSAEQTPTDEDEETCAHSIPDEETCAHSIPDEETCPHSIPDTQ